MSPVMAPDQYLQHVLQTHQRSTPFGVEAATTRAARELALTMQSAFAPLLRDVSISGSLAKGTANLGGSDLDLFLSFDPSSAPLRDLYEDVHGVAQVHGWAPQRQRVSVGITYGGLAVDLVPARQHASLFGAGDHSLYVRAQRTWTKTNVATHIITVRTSGCSNEIRLLKIWRDQHRLDLPSFLLELLVIQSLKLAPLLGPWTLAERTAKAFASIEREILTTRIVDPANTANIISDQLTVAEKLTIKRAASAAHAAILFGEWQRVVQPRL